LVYTNQQKNTEGAKKVRRIPDLLITGDQIKLSYFVYNSGKPRLQQNADHKTPDNFLANINVIN